MHTTKKPSGKGKRGPTVVDHASEDEPEPKKAKLEEVGLASMDEDEPTPNPAALQKKPASTAKLANKPHKDSPSTQNRKVAKPPSTPAPSPTAAPSAHPKSITTAIGANVAQLVSRNDKAFTVLRDMNVLEKQLNQTIKLPRLGTTYHKELKPTKADPKHAPPILLTRQRIDTIKRFYTAMDLDQDDVENGGEGLILSGPNGQGKSVLSFLLACTAYANNCLLVYIPHMNEVAKMTEDAACLEFLARIELFNASFLANIQFVPEETGIATTLAQYISAGKKTKPRFTYDVVIQELKKYTHRPVVYIIDEHNEIWKNELQKVPMWRMWTIGSGGPHGQRTYTIYSGSAHSPFELKLQSNMRKWVVRLQPLDGESFKAFVEMDAFPIAEGLQELFNNDVDDTLTYLHSVTHGNPRETRLLLDYLFENWIDDSDTLEALCEQWMFDRQDELFDEIVQFAKQQATITAPMFNNFLKHWFGDPGAQGSPRSFFDTGLLYEVVDARGRALKTFRSTSCAAYRAMLQYYFDVIVPTFTLDFKTTPLNGYRFEALVINHLKLNGFSGNGWRFDNRDEPEKLTLPPAVRFLELREHASHRNVSGGPALYLSPEERWNFPYIDAVLHVPAKKPNAQKLFFIQITISSPQSHESKKGIIKSLYKLAPRLIEDITGIGGVFLDQDHNGDIQLDLPKAHKGKLLVSFVMFTWKSSQSIDANPSDKIPPNLLIIPKESLKFIPTTVKSEEDDLAEDEEAVLNQAETENEEGNEGRGRG